MVSEPRIYAEIHRIEKCAECPLCVGVCERRKAIHFICDDKQQAVDPEGIPDWCPLVLLDQVATLEHKQWCEWAYNIASEEDLSEKRTLRWNRLLITPYEHLTDQEKESDRVYARKILNLLAGEEAFT